MSETYCILTWLDDPDARVPDESGFAGHVMRGPLHRLLPHLLRLDEEGLPWKLETGAWLAASHPELLGEDR